ncbi:anti-sigma-D factor RsdA [Rhodococcus spongiicola]|uniref:Anti-sigma-D factor RsdA sigma factor binding region domain-containing protein n=1 Tax=Rhodococcus spongiicola TaxID=2487352 RepID=A0A438B0Q0_9NOCA|nr:anti-sigma-D factor RsdA [Rhodococcus spongiicola]RVW04477.1 hypothetical protein EF834_05180 [Rhodococcus spongiicola]
MARGHNGEPGDPHADLAGNNGPVDVSAVRHDDALIDAIANGNPAATESPEEHQVAALLANWRTEIVAQPLPAEPDLDEIVERVNHELEARESLATRTRSGRRHLRLLRPIAAAAAVVAIAMGGMTIFSYNAEPGDPLWGVKQVVFTERAESTVAKIDTTSNLEEAEQLIKTGDTDGAKAKLDSAAERANGVHEAGTRSELNGWRERLLTELQRATTTPAAPSGTPSPSPSPVDQSSSTAPTPTGPSGTSSPQSTPNPPPPVTPSSGVPEPSVTQTPSPTPSSDTAVPSTPSPTPDTPTSTAMSTTVSTGTSDETPDTGVSTGSLGDAPTPTG